MIEVVLNSETTAHIQMQAGGASAKHAQDRQGEQQARQRQQHRDHRGDRQVKPPADIARQCANQQAQQNRADRACQRHRQGSPPAVQQPAELIAPELVGAQQVLRGSCLATPPGHTRRPYRNFFPAQSRWPFCGLRLARDA